MSEKIDLGDDHFLAFSEYQGEVAACTISHLTPAGKPCNGFIAFEGRSWARSFSHEITTWNVVQDEPLTLTPSVLCRGCGDHGSVQNGKWVRA